MEFLKCIKSRVAIACCWTRQPGFLKMARGYEEVCTKEGDQREKEQTWLGSVRKEREREAGAQGSGTQLLIS